MAKYFVLYDMETGEFSFLDEKEPGVGVWLDISEELINEYQESLQKFNNINRQMFLLFNNKINTIIENEDV